MPKRFSKYDRLAAEHDKKMNEVFFTAMKGNKEISADTVYDLARAELIEPRAISSRLAGLTRRFMAAGYLVKTGRFVTSKRNGASIVQIYASTLYKEPTS